MRRTANKILFFLFGFIVILERAKRTESRFHNRRGNAFKNANGNHFQTTYTKSPSIFPLSISQNQNVSADMRRRTNANKIFQELLQLCCDLNAGACCDSWLNVIAESTLLNCCGICDGLIFDVKIAIEWWLVLDKKQFDDINPLPDSFLQICRCRSIDSIESH